jgi:hypothetical protein
VQEQNTNKNIGFTEIPSPQNRLSSLSHTKKNRLSSRFIIKPHTAETIQGDEKKTLTKQIKDK